MKNDKFKDVFDLKSESKQSESRNLVDILSITGAKADAKSKSPKKNTQVHTSRFGTKSGSIDSDGKD